MFNKLENDRAVFINISFCFIDVLIVRKSRLIQFADKERESFLGKLPEYWNNLLISYILRIVALVGKRIILAKEMGPVLPGA